VISRSSEFEAELFWCEGCLGAFSNAESRRSGRKVPLTVSSGDEIRHLIYSDG